MAGKKTARVRLTKDDVREAREYSDKVLRKLGGGGRNYTGLNEPDQFYVGRLGEIAVRHWSDENCLSYDETVNDLGQPDSQDFIFARMDGSFCRANAKNSLHPRAQYLMQPVVQSEKYHYDLYIGVTTRHDRRGGAISELWGAIGGPYFKAHAERVFRKCDTLQYRLADLPISMALLASFIKKRQKPVFVTTGAKP